MLEYTNDTGPEAWLMQMTRNAILEDRVTSNPITRVVIGACD
jgi:hypothetical protein